jgi:hypothetical protein
MAESMKDFAKRGLALLILLLAAFILFKILVGVAMGIFWTLLAITVLVAAIWALARLL